jgi:hypothetical protein
MLLRDCGKMAWSKLSLPPYSFAIALSVLALGGCEKREPYSSVHGKVTFQGQPVPNAVVMFEALQGAIHVAADADESGAFEVRRSKDVPGLPLGDYRISVTPPPFYPGIGVPQSNAQPPPRNDIPMSYRDPTSSGLTLTVPDDSPIEFNIDLRPDR